MKQILDFLTELKQNNNKAWFDANRTRYKEVQVIFNQMAEQLINAIGTFDHGVRAVSLKDCTYRIYRDIRFSPDKTPYKTHIGAYICPGGKKSGNAGYYIHIEPDHSLLAVGLHCPEPKIVKSVREDIFALYPEFQKAMKQAKGFEFDFSSALKRTPREFPADAPCAEYLKLRGFDFCLSLTDKQITAPDMLERVTEIFRTTKPLNDFMNRAVNYAREEDNEQRL